MMKNSFNSVCSVTRTQEYGNEDTILCMNEIYIIYHNIDFIASFVPVFSFGELFNSNEMYKTSCASLLRATNEGKKGDKN